MAILFNIVVILGLASIVLLAFNYLKLPSIVGFLLTGIIAGPSGLGIVHDEESVEILAEIGVLLLLFSIGIELSLKKLLQVKRLVFVGGLLQVGLTIAATAGLAAALGRTTPEAVFLGFLLALSSTAIVLKILQERGMLDSLYGKATLGILIFQDIVIVPLMLIAPFLGSGELPEFDNLIWRLVLGISFLVGLLLAGRYVFPKLFQLVARTRNQELFLFFVLVICFAIAFLTQSVGLSLSLGAFLAGLVISESEYSHHALSHILPLKMLFTSLFFVSVGMLLNLHFVWTEWMLVIGVTAAVILLKMVILTLVGWVLRLNLRTVLLTVFSLWQVGEFSFILSATGLEYGLLRPYDYQMFLSVSVISMGLTPFIMVKAPALAGSIIQQRPLRKVYHRFNREPDTDAYLERKLHRLSDHLVIIGYGLNGQNVARAAKSAGIAFSIIESNPETVLPLQKQGIPILYGDASIPEVLQKASVERARIVVVAISDPLATESITAQVHQLNPSARLIIRSRYLSDVKRLTEVGATEVIPEEFETSVEIFARVLHHYLVPEKEINDLVQSIRKEHYAMLRKPSGPDQISTVHLSKLQVHTLELAKENPWIGKSLEKLAFRKRFGITVLSILREGGEIDNPDGSAILERGDRLLLLGKPDNLRSLVDPD